MQVESFGFPKGRNEDCPEKSARRNGPTPLLSVSTRFDPSEGSSTEVGTALGHQGPGDRKTRGARPSREKSCGRGPVSQFDAQAGTNTNRRPAAVGMA